MLPTVTIITASLNSGGYIEDTIRSVISQTYKNIEYIIIDGNSTDNTMKIVNKYREDIDKVITEPDNGIYEAFNKGILNSSGDVLFFLNSDDYLYDDHVIEKIANVIFLNPDLKCIYGNVKVVNEISCFSYIKGFWNLSIEDIKKGIWPQHPALFIKKDIYQKYMFNSNYRIAGDLDLIIKVFKDYGKFCHYTNLNVTVFRQNGISNNINTVIDTWRETNEIFKKHFGFERYKLNSALTPMLFYKKWMEITLLMGKPLSKILRNYKICKVAIFGSLDLALYIYKDLLNTQISTVAFLDNNTFRHGDQIDGINVIDPQWLKANWQNIDAVIIAIEHDCYDEIRNQINDILEAKRILTITWRELVALNYAK